LAPVLRHVYVAAAHGALFVVSFWVAYGLRYEFQIPPFRSPIGNVIPAEAVGETTQALVGVPQDLWQAFHELLVFVLVVKLLVFGYFRLYAGWWQYVSVQDLVETFKASHISTAIILAGVYIFKMMRGYGILKTALPQVPQYPVPDTVLIIDWAATIALVGGMRFLVRIVREGSRPVSPAGLRRILIIGAGDAGEGVLRELYRLPVERYHVVGFVDDDAKKRGIRIHGVPVLGGVDELAEVADKQSAEEVVIALPNPRRDDLRRIIEVCKGRKLTFRIVPGVADLIEGRIDVSRLREVDINDLLGREPVSLDLGQIGQFLTDRVVLVTGAGGSIGSELCRQVVAFRPGRLVMLEQAENGLFYIDRELRAAHPRLAAAAVIADICDQARLEQVFRAHRPDVVFHAAAHKHVPMMELNPGEAVKNNVFGTRNVADMACRYGAGAFVLISTDKAVNPTSVMGCTKRVAEMVCQALSSTPAGQATKFVVVRFGNVLGSAGSVVPIFREQIARGGPVTVTHPEMRRYFMTIPEATQLVIQAGAMGRSGQVMLLDMGEPVRIVDLARDMITLSGFRPDVDIQIEFQGIRPGEKLFEELRTSGEDMLPTHHRKIFIWQSQACTPQEAEAALGRLRGVCDGAGADEVLGALRSVVPEFEPTPASRAAAVADADAGHPLGTRNAEPGTRNA
jgi:FlaA1/EpsC-like NDP-sugar epimerase